MTLCIPSLLHADALTFTAADLLPPGVHVADVLGAPLAHWRPLLGVALLVAYILPCSCVQLVLNSWVNLA